MHDTDPDEDSGDAIKRQNPSDPSHHGRGNKTAETDDDETRSAPHNSVVINFNDGGKIRIIHPENQYNEDTEAFKPATTRYTGQDPVRNIRISPADIPRMQSRMSG
jgi:hypothetical protein